MSIVENLNLETVDRDHWDKHLRYINRPHSELCEPPLKWKERFAYEALEWYNKNKAHDNFAHYKNVRTLMANKVHHEGEYYCHVNFVGIDTVCSLAIYALFFAEVKLSQDAQSNEVLACCIMSPSQAWTGCLRCPSDLEILHPSPSEYNVGTQPMGYVSPGSVSTVVIEDLFEDYLYGRTPSMRKYAYPVQRLCIHFGYRDDIEGAEIRACLHEHLKTKGENYTFVKMTQCVNVGLRDVLWGHYNFLAKRVDVTNAEVELLFAETQIEPDPYPAAPVCVCYSLGPAKLVSLKRYSEFGGYYKVTTPGYRRGTDGCCCSIKHPHPSKVYTMHSKQHRYPLDDRDEEEEIRATTETQTTSEAPLHEKEYFQAATETQTTNEAQLLLTHPFPSPVMQSNQPSSSSIPPFTVQSPERSTYSDTQEPSTPKDVEPTGSAAKKRRLEDVVLHLLSLRAPDAK